jgi:hypothetical protein
MSYRDELTRLVPPPTSPAAARGDWGIVERELGLVLPVDYKAVVSTYGSGKFFRFVSVFSPFVANRPWSLGYQAQIQADNFRAYTAEGFRVPFPIYPAPGGLVCFGTTENCNCLNWLTAGHPDRWGLAIWDTDCLTMWPFPELGLAGFLVQLAKRELPQTAEGSLFTSDWFESPCFVSEDYDTPAYGWSGKAL